MRAIVMLVLACFVVAGCSPESAIEAEVRDERPSRACGEVIVRPGVPPDPGGAEMVGCLQRAHAAGEATELVVEQTTVEGDPTWAYYRSVPGRAAIQVYVDMTQDEYGPGGWSRSECPNLEWNVGGFVTCE